MSFTGMIANSSAPDPLVSAAAKVDDNLSELFTLNYALSVAAVLVSLIWASWAVVLGRSKPRLAPGVHVVGGSTRSQIKATSLKFKTESKELIRDGYLHTQAKEPFYVPSTLGHHRLIIPTRYMEELKSAPMDKVDFVGTVRDTFESEYTGVANRSRMVPNTLNSHLTPNLPKIMPEVQDELKVAINEEFPPCDDWTEVDMIDRLGKVVTRATCRMAGGKTLAHDKEWLKAAIEYTLLATNASVKIKAIWWPLKRLVAPWLPEVRKDIAWCFGQGKRVAIPLLEQREANGEHAPDFLQFLKDKGKGSEQENEFIAHIMMPMIFASTHTSILTIGALVYDLCTYPGLVEMIRAEYEPILDKDGNIPNGKYKDLVKMDSIMKESQRFNPITLLTFERIINEDRTLKDGFTIPAGSQIAVPNYQIGMDPDFYPEPEKFDPLRFEKMRNDPACATKTEFVAVNAQSMAFGYGRHACPGRQFLDQEVKSFLVKLLSNYDLKFKDGQTRVSNFSYEALYVLPHMPVMLKRRSL